MSSKRIAVLSPHLDDAVASCWTVLESPADVLVVNVFAGIPEPGSGTHLWDAITKADDSPRRMQERLDEDREALSQLGRPAVNLGFLDAQYRDDEHAPDQLAAALGPHVQAAAAVYAPAGIGGHPDHVLARDAALTLRQDVRLYADQLYATLYGWPPWVDGRPSEPFLDVDAYWRHHLPPGLWSAQVSALDAAAYERKLDAVNCYRTQLAAFKFADPGVLAHEVFWEPSAST